MATTAAAPRAASATVSLHLALIRAVDQVPQIAGAGIVLIDARGNPTTVRGGPRRLQVHISLGSNGPGAATFAVGAGAPASAPAKAPPPGFWERWGESVFACGSAGATGLAIYLTGGTASFVVGAFAVNSAALCGASFGKALQQDAWKDFEAAGGGAYRTWLTVETLMSLADLCSGVGGAAKFLGQLKAGGKLLKLEKAVARQNLNRRQLLKLIQEIDPKFRADLAGEGASYVKRGKLVQAGAEVLSKTRFKGLNNHHVRTLSEGVGNALTVFSPYNGNTFNNAFELWLVEYEE